MLMGMACLQAVTARQGAALSSERMAAAVDEVANLVTDSDLLATPLALRFCLKLLPQQPKNADQISSRFLPAALQLVKSPLLQVSHSGISLQPTLPVLAAHTGTAMLAGE